MNYSAVGSIIKKSFLESLKGRIWKWLFGSLPALLAVLLMSKNILGHAVIESIKWALIVCSILFVVRFISRGIINSFKFLHLVYKESVYGDAIITLKNSFGKVHLYRKSPGYQDVEFMDSMVEFCNGLKEIFDKVTGTECSVSIKIPLKNQHVDEKTILRNLCRDKKHYNVRDTSSYKKTPHTIIGNTCFSRTLNQVLKRSKERYYLNNDIPNTSNYANTSLGCFENDTELPYKSELVHAIVPLMENDKSNYRCHGFVCIDSNKKNAFEKKYAIAIVEGVADGIYDVMNERNKQNP